VAKYHLNVVMEELAFTNTIILLKAVMLYLSIIGRKKNNVQGVLFTKLLYIIM
jgi:hypothetical protein